MHSRMNDATVTLNTVVMVTCWMAAVALTAVSFTELVSGELKPPTCTAAILFMALGVVRWVAHMLAELERSQRNVFEIGRDYERIQQGQPPLHSVQ